MNFFTKLLIFIFISLCIAWVYACSLIGVEDQVKIYFQALKTEIKQQDYKPDFFVISGRRWKLDNYILTKISGVASKSKHKKGQAIDILVFDVNDDGKSDKQDVDFR